jgi:hypothetical protein
LLLHGDALLEDGLLLEQGVNCRGFGLVLARRPEFLEPRDVAGLDRLAFDAVPLLFQQQLQLVDPPLSLHILSGKGLQLLASVLDLHL